MPSDIKLLILLSILLLLLSLLLLLVLLLLRIWSGQPAHNPCRLCASCRLSPLSIDAADCRRASRAVQRTDNIQRCKRLIPRQYSLKLLWSKYPCTHGRARAKCSPAFNLRSVASHDRGDSGIIEYLFWIWMAYAAGTNWYHDNNDKDTTKSYETMIRLGSTGGLLWQSPCHPTLSGCSPG